MRASSKFIVHLAATLAVILATGSALLLSQRVAALSPDQPATQTTTSAPLSSAIAAGNYCIGCHTAADARLANMTVGGGIPWRGEIVAAELTPCPAMKKIHEELYYTERLLLAIDRYQSSLPGYADTSGLDSRLAAGQQGYLRLLDAPVTSLDAFVSEAQSVRFKLGKVYSGLQAVDESAKRMRVLIWGLIVTLVVLGSLAWGLYNTRHVPLRTGKLRPGSVLKIAAFLILIAAFFSLPLLRVPQVEAASTAEALAVQTELDTVQRAGDAAERAMARGWIIGKIAAHWQAKDPAQGEGALAMALQAAEEARGEAAALWGEATAAQEASVSSPAKMEKAGLIAGELQAARGRAWNYRMMAENWYLTGTNHTGMLLDAALAALPPEDTIYTDLDRRSIAVISWAALDADQALAALRQVQDPALQAWGLREIAGMSGSQKTYQEAVEAARLIQDPLRKALALGEIAASYPQGVHITELAALLAESDPNQRAYTLAILAGQTGSQELADSIGAGFSAAQALAYLRLGRFQQAWDAGEKIADPYERARAQSEIASSWAQAGDLPDEIINEIQIPLLRDRTMRNVIRITGNASLVDLIGNSYDRTLALTYLGGYDEAEVLAGGLKEAYPLLALALAVAEDDPQRALALTDKLQREVDKALVLQAVAAETGEAEFFERALAMAAAARVRGDALAPAQASLDLSLRFFDIDPVLAQQAMQQALDLAERISIK